MITVVGIGPGHPDYIVPAAFNCIRDAEVLIGGKRHLDAIDTSGKQVYFITSDIKATLEAIKSNAYKKVAVVVSGDPGFYSILRTIRENLPGLSLNVIPGISSVQLLFSAIAQDWQDVTLASVHARPVNMLDEIVGRSKKVCILTDNKITAPEVARYLTKSGINGRAVTGKNLSYQNQELLDTTIDELALMDGFDSSVLYIEIGD